MELKSSLLKVHIFAPYISLGTQNIIDACSSSLIMKAILNPKSNITVDPIAIGLRLSFSPLQPVAHSIVHFAFSC
jgi:hypothetical protein